MHAFILNLIIGIIGGIFSSVIVTRIFLIRSELEEQIELLKMTYYRFGGIKTYFDVIEQLLKLSNDTSADIEKEIQRDPNYLKTHDTIHAKDAINSIKSNLMDKTINEICDQDAMPLLKEEDYLKLHNETRQLIMKYKKLDVFKFKTIDECKKEIDELKEKYQLCFKGKTKVFIRMIVRDKTLIVLALVFVALCVLAYLSH